MGEAAAEPNPRRAWDVVLRIIVATAILLGGVFVLGSFFREPLEAAGSHLYESAGLVGISLLVLVCDPLPGLGFQPGLLLGTAANVPWALLFPVTALSSLMSSALGWGIGHAGRNNRTFLRFLSTTGASPALARWGVRAVALASITPLPYGLATMAAGSGGLPFRILLLASTARWLKIAASLAAIKTGWNLGA